MARQRGTKVKTPATLAGANTGAHREQASISLQRRAESDQIKLHEVEIVGSFVTLTPKSGNRWVGLCPFHEDSKPSLIVYGGGGGYHCFACGAHGDVFTFVMRHRGVSFIDAKREAAQIAGVRLADARPLSASEKSQWAEQRRRAERAADDLVEWRTGKLLELRRERNRFYRSEATVSAAARVLLANPGANDEAAWDAIWSAAQDDLRGDVLQDDVERLADLKPGELAACRARLEARAA